MVIPIRRVVEPGYAATIPIPSPEVAAMRIHLYHTRDRPWIAEAPNRLIRDAGDVVLVIDCLDSEMLTAAMTRSTSAVVDLRSV